MSTAMNKVAPAVRRLLASRSQSWSKQASKSFSSIVTRSTTIPSVFAFKQSSRASSTGSKQLVDCLATEIQSELADDEIDNEFVDSKKQIEKLFTISDVSGQGTVILKREFNGEIIEITFDCQDEAEMDAEDDMKDEGDLETPEPTEEEDDELGSTMEFGINFDVKITKPTGEKIVILCVASRNLIVRSVRHLEAGVDVEDTLSYAGPVFEQLNEELQDSFYSYLEERAIGEDLSFFVLSYSRVKEQSEYSNWLNKVMTFADKK